MELTKTDKMIINNIASIHEVDQTVVEKLYTEMIIKAKSLKKIKENFENLKAKQLKK